MDKLKGQQPIIYKQYIHYRVINNNNNNNVKVLHIKFDFHYMPQLTIAIKIYSLRRYSYTSVS